jgi:hypothetical protein
LLSAYVDDISGEIYYDADDKEVPITRKIVVDREHSEFPMLDT